jgi:hypothetical protein
VAHVSGREKNCISEVNFLREKTKQNEDVRVVSNKISSYRHLAETSPTSESWIEFNERNHLKPRDNVFTWRYEQNISRQFGLTSVFKRDKRYFGSSTPVT